MASAGYESDPVFGPNSSLIAQNAANDNRLFGIYAPYGREGGGNRAKENGITNCVGVAC